MGARVIKSMIPLLLLLFAMTSPSNANICSDFGINSLAGVWEAVGFTTCVGCSHSTFINISLCAPLPNSGCGSDSAVCYTDAELYPNERNIAVYSSSAPIYDMNNKTLEIKFEFDLQSNIKGTTTINLFCGTHLGHPMLLHSDVGSGLIIIDWETSALCFDKTGAAMQENKCYFANLNLANFQVYLYDLSFLVKTNGAYNITSNGVTYALNLCQKIIPGSDNYLHGCENSVFCELGMGSDGAGLPLFSTANSTGVKFQNQQLTIDYITNLQSEVNCSGDTRFTMAFHCPYEWNIAPGPQLTASIDKCYYHIDWYTDYSCAQTYTILDKCTIVGRGAASFSFNLTSLSTQLTITPNENTNYTFSICSDGVRCAEILNSKICMTVSGVDHSLGSGISNLRYTDNIITATYYKGSLCPFSNNNIRYSTTIRFICNDTNGQPEFIVEDSCTYFFDWPTPLACHTSSKSQRCDDVSFKESTYDLTQLKREDGDNWEAAIATTINFHTQSRFLINLCGPLNIGSTQPNSAPVGCDGYSICNVTRSSNQGIPIGKFDSIKGRSNNVLVATYQGGSCTNSKPYRADIVIICKIGVTDSSPVYVGEIDSCYYEFQWEHSAACPIVRRTVTGNNCQVQDPSSLDTYSLFGLALQQDNLYQLQTDKYDYQLSICTNFSDNIQASLPDVCKISGACQSSLDSSRKNYSLGVANSQLIYSNGSLKLIYEGGSSGCNGQSRVTEVSFVCVLEQEDTSGLKEVYEPTGCNYSFIFYTGYACPFEYLFIDCTYTDSTGHTFDLSPLMRTYDNWNVTLGSGSVLSTVRFYINICRPVNNIPGCHPFSAACISYKENGINKWASIGKPKIGIIQVDSVSSDGLQLIYTEDEQQNISGICSVATNPKTSIVFRCPEDQTDSARNLPMLSNIDKYSCVFYFEWYTLEACATVPSSGSCAVTDPASGFVYSFSALSNKVHYLTIDSSTKIAFSVCSPLDETSIQSYLGNTHSTSVSAILYYPLLDQSSSPESNISIGSVSRSLQYADNQILLEYANGDPCTNTNTNISTLITFVCDPYNLHGRIEFIGVTNLCIYPILFYTSLACPVRTSECVVSSTSGQVYDLTNLKYNSQEGYEVVLSEVTGFNSGDRVYIGVCQPIELVASSNCPTNSSSCLFGNDSGAMYSLGAMTGDLQVVGDEVRILYSGGNGCSAETSSSATLIRFRCDSTAGEGTPRMVLHEVSGDKFCYSEIIWATTRACAVSSTTNTGCAVTDNTGFTYNYTSLREAGDIAVSSQSGDEHYRYTLGICRAITGNCGDISNNVGACQWDTDTNAYYMTGMANSNVTLQNGETKLTYLDGTACHQNNVARSTVITFRCSTDADNQNHAVINPEDTYCVYEIDVYTRLACTPSWPTYKCSVESNLGVSYDLSTLQQRLYYEVVVSETSVYYFSVCRPLPSIYGNHGVTCSSGQAMCLLQKINGSWIATDLGYQTQGPVLPQESIILLTYSNFTQRTNKYCNSTIIMSCPQTRALTLLPRLLTTSGCDSSFLWSTYAACPTESTISNNCIVTQYRTSFYIDLASFKVKNTSISINSDNDIIHISVCDDLSSSNLGKCSSTSTSICLTKSNTHTPLTYINSTKWFIGEEIVVSYFVGTQCSSNTQLNNTAELVIKCGDSEVLSAIEPDAYCVWRLELATPKLCQYEVPCFLYQGGITYDLNPLKAYDNNWYVGEEGSSDMFLINVCHNLLPDDANTCNATSAICMINDGKPTSLGGISSDLQYVTDGKLKIEYTNGDLCDSGQRYNSTLYFECVTNPAEENTFAETNIQACHYEFTWYTHLACSGAENITAIGKCDWEDSVTGDVYDFNAYANKSFPVSNDNSIKLVACGIMANSQCSNGASICANGINYGTYNGGLQFGSSGRLELHYTNGDSCGGSANHSSIVEFQCNSHNYIEHSVSLDTECKHYFTWNTPLACKGEISSCSLLIDNRYIDLSMLAKSNNAWVIHTGHTDYSSILFNPCYSMRGYLDSDKNANSISCSSNSFACIINKNKELIEIGSLETATMTSSSDGKAILLTGTSNNHDPSSNKIYSVEIIFSDSMLLFGEVAFKRESIHNSETQIVIKFGTNLLNSNPIVDSNGYLTNNLSDSSFCQPDNLFNQDYSVTVLNDTFHINFCSFAKNCPTDASVCMVTSIGDDKSTLSLSNYTKHNILQYNASFYQLIMSSKDASCDEANRPYLTVFHIYCGAEYSQTSTQLKHVSTSECLYLFSIEVPESYCEYFNNNNTNTNSVSSGNSSKTFLIFFIVALLGIFAIFIAFLATVLCYKRFSKSEKWFYKLKFSLSKKTIPQYRFSKLKGSEIGKLINSDASDSEDETTNLEPVISAESSTIVTLTLDDSPKFIENGNNSEDDEFIKL